VYGHGRQKITKGDGMENFTHLNQEKMNEVIRKLKEIGGQVLSVSAILQHEYIGE